MEGFTFCAEISFHAYLFFTNGYKMAEVAGVTFSNSDSAPVPKFLNPGPNPK